MDDSTTVAPSRCDRSFSASRPSLSLSTRFPSFPIFLFRSVSPVPRPVLPPSSRSPPFLFVFRGDRAPETDVRAVKNGHRRASATATSPFACPPFPPPHPRGPRGCRSPNSTSDALVPGPLSLKRASSDRPSRVLPFCSSPASSVRHWPSTRTVSI